MSRPPRIPNWLPWEKRTIYFITFCIESRKSVLANAQAWNICRAVFEKLDKWRILFAIAMPDHLHILAAPASRNASISDFAKWFKRWFNEAYRTSNHRPSVPEGAATDWRWQEGCFDRLLRSDESLSEMGIPPPKSCARWSRRAFRGLAIPVSIQRLTNLASDTDALQFRKIWRGQNVFSISAIDSVQRLIREVSGSSLRRLS